MNQTIRTGAGFAGLGKMSQLFTFVSAAALVCHVALGRNHLSPVYVVSPNNFFSHLHVLALCNFCSNPHLLLQFTPADYNVAGLAWSFPKILKIQHHKASVFRGGNNNT